MIISLKRFKSSHGYFNEKVSERVEFPLNGLDMAKFQLKAAPPGEKLIYDLYAVSNHYGSMSFGHYTAFCKNNNNWYDFDDSSVSKVDDDKVITEAAYNLFYKLRGFCEEENVDFELIRNKLDD
jgi:ubiquitin C-terminal hydrolase